MGTYFTHGASRADVVRECLTNYTRQAVPDDTEARTAVHTRVLAYNVTCNILWTVVESVDSLRGVVLQTNIACDLLVHSDIGWGYKPMSESVHPYYYDCPEAFLALAPDDGPGDRCPEWRARVRAYHTDVGAPPCRPM